MNDSMSIADRVAALRWFHSIDLGGGIVTPGQAPIEFLDAVAAIYFRGGVARGASVLDIGCWDGFNSLEAVRRGASRVIAHRAIGSGITTNGHRSGPVRAGPRGGGAGHGNHGHHGLPDVTPDSVGKFDIVLFCGVLYHLPDMMAGLCARGFGRKAHADRGDAYGPRQTSEASGGGVLSRHGA